MSSATFGFGRAQLGSLECGVIRPLDTTKKIRRLAVLCHGFGAGGDDLVGLASEMLQLVPQDEATMLVFPAAPLSLDDEGMPGGRAWWMLSIQRLLSAIEDGQYELVREEVPDGIDEAREMLVETVTAALELAQVSEDQLFLGGFSQGAMLSVDTAIRGLEKPPAKLCLFSGCLICERQWKAGVARLSSVDIFQSHGSLDPILPLQTGKWLTEMLRENGCAVDFLEFAGVHTIPLEAIERAARMLGSIGEE